MSIDISQEDRKRLSEIAGKAFASGSPGIDDNQVFARALLAIIQAADAQANYEQEQSEWT